MKTTEFRFTAYEAETLRQLTGSAIHELLRKKTILQLNFANFRYRSLEVFESLDAILDNKDGNGDDVTRKVALEFTHDEAYELGILANSAAATRRSSTMVCELAGTDSLDFLMPACRKLYSALQSKRTASMEREQALCGMAERLEDAMIDNGLFDMDSFTTVGTVELSFGDHYRVTLDMVPRAASVKVTNHAHPEREYNALNEALIDRIDFRRIEKALDMAGMTIGIISTENVTA